MITILLARENDLNDIVQFQEKMALETENLVLDPVQLNQGVKNVFLDESKGFYLIAKVEAKTVGCLLITKEWSDWRNKMIFWIQSVYVLPEYREKGVFRTMYRYVKDMVEKDENLGGCRLYVDKTNLKAQKIYSHIGMNGEHYRFFEWMK